MELALQVKLKEIMGGLTGTESERPERGRAY